MTDYGKFVQNLKNNLPQVNAVIKSAKDSEKVVDAQLQSIKNKLQELQDLEVSARTPATSKGNSEPLTFDELDEIFKSLQPIPDHPQKLKSTGSMDSTRTKSTTLSRKPLYSSYQVLKANSTVMPKPPTASMSTLNLNTVTVEPPKITDLIDEIQHIQDQFNEISFEPVVFDDVHVDDQWMKDVKKFSGFLVQIRNKLEQAANKTQSSAVLDDKEKELGVSLQNVSKMIQDILEIHEKSKKPEINHKFDDLFMKELQDLMKVLVEAYGDDM